jgi:hypothetical protein
VSGEHDHECDPKDDRDDDLDRAEAARGADFGETVREQRQPGRHQREADEVEPLGRLALDARQHPQRGDDRDRPDRDVDVEDPAPAEVVDDQAAERRPEDRREHHRHGDDAHHAPHPFRPGCLGEHQLADRQDHPAADALQDAEHDQLGARGRETTQRRPGSEDHDREQVHALGAETPRRPARDRDHGRERQQVAGHDPLNLADRGVQLAAERPQRDVDDRRVEDRHNRSEDHDAADSPDEWVQALALHKVPKD